MLSNGTKTNVRKRSMEELNVIADVAGQYDTLQALIKKMPPGKIILLGDLNDRGPKSKEVIEWAMNTPNVVSLHSNHGDMFVDFMLGFRDPDHLTMYHYQDFFNNGGGFTIKSYVPELESTRNMIEALTKIPMEHIHWLKDLPLTYEAPGILCSHAPFEETYHRTDAVWNRGYPSKKDGILQVFGHNSHWGLRWFDDWAVCLDASRQQLLTGLHWPSKTIYQQEYI